MAFFENGYALVVGIANYAHVRKLPDSVLEDARSISRLLQDENYGGYPPGQVRLLTDAQATAVNIQSGLAWLAEKTGGEDTAVLYFSGHGGQIETGPHAGDYLIPYEATAADLAGTAIADKNLITILNKIQAERLLVLFDCCHAGGIGDVKGGVLTPDAVVKSGLDEKLYDRLGQGKGRAVIASSRSDEVSWVFPDMPNSLFTHHMLQALKGNAPMRGDGLVRLFDLFEYVSERVSADQPQQHPILKAEIEKNFPIALHLGGKKTIIADTADAATPAVARQPHMQNHQQITLKNAEHAVLTKMFAEHERVVIKGEFGGGYGGGRVWWIRPIRQGEEAELPVVVKTGPASIIQQETDAYKKFVHQKVPNVASIEGEPVLSSDKTWAGIRYPLAGHGRFYTESFKAFCQHASTKDITYVLEKRLFYSIDQMWQINQVSREAFIAGSFDPILPVNLFIQFSSESYDNSIQLDPNIAYHQTCQPGNLISLSGFIVEEIDARKSELTLNLPLTDERVTKSYRLRITDVPDMSGYKEGEMLSQPINGLVKDTRDTYFQKLINRIFDGKLNAQTKNISVAGIGNLPNPLAFLTALKSETHDVKTGPIHGDLNLENILVEYDQHNHDVVLIDFASARVDMVLHDLWRLETGIWLYLVPGVFQENGRSLADLPNFLHALHTTSAGLGQPAATTNLAKPFLTLAAIRQQAKHYFVQTNAWNEYYRGLIPYLLGALKFKNVDQLPTAPLPKQIAFITAATILQIIQDPPKVTQEPEVQTAYGATQMTRTEQPSHEKSDQLPKQQRQPRPKNLRMVLLEILNKHFSDGDLRILCVDMEIDYENIPGPAKIDKARELILYLQRYNRLEELIDYAQPMHPEADWPD